MPARRRGISEIVASLLLILIVSSLGTVLYSYTLQVNQIQQDSLLRSSSTQMQQAQQRFRATAAWWSGTGNEIRVTVLNYGLNMIQVSDVYVNGQRVLTWGSGKLTDVKIGGIVNLQFTSPVAIASGGSYSITIVSSKGVVHEYVFKP